MYRLVFQPEVPLFSVGLLNIAGVDELGDVLHTMEPVPSGYFLRFKISNLCFVKSENRFEDVVDGVDLWRACHCSKQLVDFGMFVA